MKNYIYFIYFIPLFLLLSSSLVFVPFPFKWWVRFSMRQNKYHWISVVSNTDLYLSHTKPHSHLTIIIISPSPSCSNPCFSYTPPSLRHTQLVNAIPWYGICMIGISLSLSFPSFAFLTHTLSHPPTHPPSTSATTEYTSAFAKKIEYKLNWKPIHSQIWPLKTHIPHTCTTHTLTHTGQNQDVLWKLAFGSVSDIIRSWGRRPHHHLLQWIKIKRWCWGFPFFLIMTVNVVVILSETHWSIPPFPHALSNFYRLAMKDRWMEWGAKKWGSQFTRTIYTG